MELDLNIVSELKVHYLLLNHDDTLHMLPVS